MVDRSYSVDKPPAPPAWKWAFDQHVVPAAINLAGGAEGIALRGARWSRRRPVRAGLLVAAIATVPVLMAGRRA